MESARLLAEKGHDVTLWEREKDFGGTARIAALAYEPNERLIDYLAGEMHRLPIEVQLGKTATAEDIRSFNADHVVLATGAIRKAPNIPGKSQRHVFDGDELRGVLFGGNKLAAAKLSLLARLILWAGNMTQALRSISLMRFASRFWMPIADEVTIIGGGLVGLELAEYLVGRGRKITVIEPGPSLGAELAIVRRARVLHTLREHNVTIFSNSPIDEITADSVRFQHDGVQQSVKAKHCRRYGLLGSISLLSPAYLLSVERWPFHSGPPDHYDRLSSLLVLSDSQSGWLMPLHSTTDFRPV